MLELQNNSDFKEKTTLFADVILPVPMRSTFTYRIPFEWNETIQEGARVVVQFGARRVLTGIVLRLHSQPPTDYKVKYALELLDEMPLVNPIQLKLWQWMADYYLCGIGEVMNAALPSGLKLSSLSKIQLNPEFLLKETHTKIDLFASEEYTEGLTKREQKIVDALQEQQTITFEKAADLIGAENIYKTIKDLIKKEIILIFEDVQEKYKPKTTKKIRLAQKLWQQPEEVNQLLTSLEKAPKQQEGLLKYLSEIPLAADWETHREGIGKTRFIESNISDSILKTLIQKGIFEEYEQVVSRFAGYSKTLQTIQLSDSQHTIIKDLEKQFQTKDVALLHGVTGSGKTEMYIRLIEKVLESGSQVLFLLPEIALTTQIVERLKKVFGDRMGVYHSKFSDNERVEVWKGVLDGIFPIVVGVRSAIFLPFSHLGLIVVDEEHDGSYKQYEPAPRYNARDMALVLANLHHAKVLLGSATPSIESNYLAQQQKYGYAKATQRFGNAQLPEIEFVNLQEERKRKTMKGAFSSAMLNAIAEALAKKEQIILFQNRRGYAPYLTCDNCDWIPHCTNCSVSLTLHLYSNELRCHYCGYRDNPPALCQNCGSTKIRNVGFGTEKIEDELKSFFPDIAVQRMDLDTTRSKNGYQTIIQDFTSRNIDVLVGTQMVTKGLDFDNVSLVGVFDVDRMLHFPDFRSFERTFQLIMQVSGRAGRKDVKGRVLVQTSNPQHIVLQRILANDYETFYEVEIKERERYHYPPFTRLIRLVVKSEDVNLCIEAATDLANTLKQQLGAKRVLGAEVPLIEKIRNQYMREIFIKLERNKIDLGQVKQFITQTLQQTENKAKYKAVKVLVDIDPS